MLGGAWGRTTHVVAATATLKRKRLRAEVERAEGNVVLRIGRHEGALAALRAASHCSAARRGERAF